MIALIMVTRRLCSGSASRVERALERPDLAIKVAYALIFLGRERRLRPLLEFSKVSVDIGLSLGPQARELLSR